MPFKPGQSGNPKGRAVEIDPEFLNEIKSNKNGARRLIWKYMAMTGNEYNAKVAQAERGELSMNETCLLKLIEQIYVHGADRTYATLLTLAGGRFDEIGRLDLTAEEEVMLERFRSFVKAKEDESLTDNLIGQD